MTWGKNLSLPFAKSAKPSGEGSSAAADSPTDNEDSTEKNASTAGDSPDPTPNNCEHQSSIAGQKNESATWADKLSPNIRRGATNVLTAIKKFTPLGSTSKPTTSRKKKSFTSHQAFNEDLTMAASALEGRIVTSAQVAKKKEPRLQLDSNGRDWVVENHKNAGAPLNIDDAKMNQNIFLRDNKNATVSISKKFNNLTLENCDGVNVVVQSVISAIEMIRCKKCQVQVLGHAQAIAIDNSQGIHIYASLESKGIQITNSQNSEINLHVPESEAKKDDWIEIAVPCQFVHSLDPKTNILSSKVSDLYH